MKNLVGVLENKMAYKKYQQIIDDQNYRYSFNHNQPWELYYKYLNRAFNMRYIFFKISVKKLNKVWEKHMKFKYKAASKQNTRLGKFIREFPLPLKEFLCLMEFIEYGEIMPSYDIHWMDRFKEQKVRFNSSLLKKYKLVFLIQNPLNPMRKDYIISYKAQLALKGKQYTDAYQQLDMALEEESKKNSPEDLDSLFYVEIPKKSFKDLIVSDKTMKDLKVALARANQGENIFNTKGLSKVDEYCKGITLNMRGFQGTGKTLAAYCLAKEMGKKLLIVRYGQLQNCDVREREKDIQRAFKLAKAKDAVIFFDEADTIAFDSDDSEKSWEMSQNMLLKELEIFEGVCVFATNFSRNYSAAFERRLTMHIDFDMPGKQQCQQILDKLLPKRSRDKDIRIYDLDLEFLSGGLIKNIVLNASGFAARDNAEKIMQKHLKEAILSVRGNKGNKDAVSYIC